MAPVGRQRGDGEGTGTQAPFHSPAGPYRVCQPWQWGTWWEAFWEGSLPGREPVYPHSGRWGHPGVAPWQPGPALTPMLGAVCPPQCCLWLWGDSMGERSWGWWGQGGLGGGWGHPKHSPNA